MVGEADKVYLYGLFVLCSVFISAHSQGREIDFSYTCEKEGATRHVAVVSNPGYTCRVKYTKSSVTTFPWNARNDAGYCRPKAFELVEKLGASGWECDSAEDVKSILIAQIERYDQYLKTSNSVGKICYFYPTEAQFGNLCGDERAEAAIVYTCEIDLDNWNQYLAVFLEIESEPLIKEVGGSGYRQLSSYYFDSDGLTMETEKVDFAGNPPGNQNSVEKASIQCRYSAASEWKLIEE